MSMVIISGNIDISVDALIGVLATISGSLAVAGAPIIVTWLAPLVVGVAVMAAQGAIIAYCGPGHRRHARHAVDPQRRPYQRHRRKMDHRSAAELPSRRPLPLGVPMPVIIMVLATVLAAIWMRDSPTGVRSTRLAAILRPRASAASIRSAPC